MLEPISDVSRQHPLTQRTQNRGLARAIWANKDRQRIEANRRIADTSKSLNVNELKHGVMLAHASANCTPSRNGVSEVGHCRHERRDVIADLVHRELRIRCRGCRRALRAETVALDHRKAALEIVEQRRV